MYYMFLPITRFMYIPSRTWQVGFSPLQQQVPSGDDSRHSWTCGHERTPEWTPTKEGRKEEKDRKLSSLPVNRVDMCRSLTCMSSTNPHTDKHSHVHTCTHMYNVHTWNHIHLASWSLTFRTHTKPHSDVPQWLHTQTFHIELHVPLILLLTHPSHRHTIHTHKNPLLHTSVTFIPLTFCHCYPSHARSPILPAPFQTHPEQPCSLCRPSPVLSCRLCPAHTHSASLPAPSVPPPLTHQSSRNYAYPVGGDYKAMKLWEVHILLVLWPAGKTYGKSVW